MREDITGETDTGVPAYIPGETDAEVPEYLPDGTDAEAPEYRTEETDDAILAFLIDETENGLAGETSDEAAAMTDTDDEDPKESPVIAANNDANPEGTVEIAGTGTDTEESEISADFERKSKTMCWTKSIRKNLKYTRLRRK